MKTGAIEMEKLMKWLLIIIVVGVIIAIFFPMLTKGGKSFEGPLECNTQFQRCSCLFDGQENGCPSEAVSKTFFSSNCPQECAKLGASGSENFDKKLEDARNKWDGKEVTKSKYFGTCCKGNWKDYE